MDGRTLSTKIRTAASERSEEGSYSLDTSTRRLGQQPFRRLYETRQGRCFEDRSLAASEVIFLRGRDRLYHHKISPVPKIRAVKTLRR